MLAEYCGTLPGRETVLQSCMNLLLVHLFRKLAVVQGDDTPDILLQIARYIEENPNADLSLPTLAKKRFYNPSYFSPISAAPSRRPSAPLFPITSGIGRSPVPLPSSTSENFPQKRLPSGAAFPPPPPFTVRMQKRAGRIFRLSREEKNKISRVSDTRDKKSPGGEHGT